tara:strand:+ start:222 stop:422 length:201 start_codon:yes stop_codon:yes gene_type:complete
MECGMQAGESWKWTDDANRQPMALEHEELAEVIPAWPMLSPHLWIVIPAIVRSVAEADDALLTETW